MLFSQHHLWRFPYSLAVLDFKPGTYWVESCLLVMLVGYVQVSLSTTAGGRGGAFRFRLQNLKGGPLAFVIHTAEAGIPDAIILLCALLLLLQAMRQIRFELRDGLSLVDDRLDGLWEISQKHSLAD